MLRKFGELRERRTSLYAPMSVDFASVTPHVSERPQKAAGDSFAIGVALYVDFGFAAVVLVTGLCLLA